MQSPNRPAHHDLTTTLLLSCGAVAGPLFTAVYIIAGVGRPFYDPLRHPISSLAIGEQGWLQSANFIVTGLLLLAFAAGLRRVLPPHAGRDWGPLLIGLAGIGLLGAGFFVTDPLNGYPPGTPLLPSDYTLPGRLHRLFSALVFLGVPGAAVVFGRRFRAWGRRGWALYSWATAIAFLALFVVTSVGFAQLAGLEAHAGLLQRITLSVGWLWLTLLALRVLLAPGGRAPEEAG